MIPVDRPHPLLGGLTPARFMRLHWQKKPLFVPGARAGVTPPMSVADLFDLAGRDGVESRLVRRLRNAPGQRAQDDRWTVRHGPIPRRSLPARRQPDWTLLVQGVDLHRDEAHALLAPFRFAPDARLDDLMVSFATDGGGVGPHVDSYDVFLLQLHGRRRWRVGPVADATFVPGMPLRLLAHFEPTDEWLCEPGDLLYVPPGWGHDGVAEGGECMTASVGYRAPAAEGLAAELLQRLLEAQDSQSPDRLYRDPSQPATGSPAAIPEALQRFSVDSVRRWLGSPQALQRELALALGEVMSEPKPGVWFDPAEPDRPRAGGPKGSQPVAVRLDRRTRMLHDRLHVFINGEAFTVGGRDGRLLRQLADARRLTAAQVGRLGADAHAALAEWQAQGWLHPEAGPGAVRT